MTHFIQLLIDEGRTVQGVPIDGGWLEIDTVADPDQYREMHQAGEQGTFVDLDS